MKTIKIEMLYPEFNNLYGDRGNLLCLTKKLSACNVTVEVIGTHLHETPAFSQQNDIDCLILGPCSEYQQELELERLIPCREAMKERLENGQVTLATGNAFELFGEYIQRENGEQIPAMGLFPYHAKRFERVRFNDLCVGDMDGMLVTGFKNQLSHSYGELPSPMMKMITGAGCNPDSRLEGIHINHFFATYFIGPLLPLNPPFTDSLVQTLTGDDYQSMKLPWESMAYQCRLKELAPAANII